MSRHSDEFGISRQGAANIRAAEAEGYIDDTLVNGATTVAEITDAVTGGHADQVPNQHRILRGIGLVGPSGLNELTDTVVNGAATVDELTVPTAGANDVNIGQAIE